MPITLPTKPDVATPQPVPQIGHLLGRGSLALVKGELLEIRNSEGNKIAQGTLDKGVGWPDRPWSHSGDALVYFNSGFLRLMNFSSGEDRLLYKAPLGLTIREPFIWINGGKQLLFHLTPPDRPPITIWSIGIDGKGLEQFHPNVIDPADSKYLSDIMATDVSRNGQTILLRGTNFNSNGGIESSAVLHMDISTKKALNISPSGQKFCLNGRFLDEKRVVINCLQQVTNGPLPADTYLMGTNGEDPRKLAAGERVGLFIQDVSPDGSSIAVAETWMPGNPSSKDAVYVINASSGNRIRVAEATEGNLVKPIGFTVDGKGFYVLIQKRPQGSRTSEGVLNYIDLSTGIAKTVFDEVTAAFIAD